jgi:choline dehydrogenase-like flavoprotein
MGEASTREGWDVLVIGSGFGGAMAAHAAIEAGLRVLMIERGDWVARGPANWEPEGVWELTPYVATSTPYRVLAGADGPYVRPCHCVGGLSVFYGGVSLRLRERDFEPEAAIVADSCAAWPYRYADLEPYYTRAERLLGVAGEAGVDPTEPFRSAPYPQPPAPLAPASRRIERAARALGLTPFRLPLAIHYAGDDGRAPCVACMTCDGFACAIGAKNDIASAILPALLARGLALETRTAALRLITERGRVTGVECVREPGGERFVVRARAIILAAGALASPHLVLASGLERWNPAGAAVGRYLMRHCNAIVYGVFPRRPNPERLFHKQLGIHDYYFGHPSVREPAGPLGAIQQLSTPPLALVRERAPAGLGRFLGPAVEHLTGLLVIAADQPRAENRVTVDWADRDRLGLPRLVITHRYTERDLAARRALIRAARRILWRAGARWFYVHRIRTFSHAAGTLRIGTDPASAPLDEWGRFRGIENLYVADGSFMPTSGAVNPSLTIAAHALRCGEHVARVLTARAARPAESARVTWRRPARLQAPRSAHAPARPVHGED